MHADRVLAMGTTVATFEIAELYSSSPMRPFFIAASDAASSSPKRCAVVPDLLEQPQTLDRGRPRPVLWLQAIDRLGRVQRLTHLRSTPISPGSTGSAPVT